MRRIRRYDLTRDKLVEQHPDRRQVLLYGRNDMAFLQQFEVGRDVQRPNTGKRQAVLFAP